METTSTRSSEASEAGYDMDALYAAAEQQLVRVDFPDATYRLQFNARFQFSQAAELADYFAALGITHAYASPYLKAAPGSMHGYDIVDHSQLNPEIGTEQTYNEFVQALHERGVRQILDVVPNHMGVASNDNQWWLDVLENGPSSPYAAFFDINWMPLKQDLANKVLLPVLGDQFGVVLENQELRLALEDGAFAVWYYDRRFPIGPRSSAQILGHRIENLERTLGAESAELSELQSILTAIGHLPTRTEADPERRRERRREKEVIKRRLAELCRASTVVLDFINENVRLFNGTKGHRQSFDLLDALLLNQAYRLSYWRVAADEINYRRFFDLNELAAICMEQPAVFQATHKLIFQLLSEGKINGMRIDHPDGLYDPAGYLRGLQRERVSQAFRAAFDDADPVLSPLLPGFAETDNPVTQSPEDRERLEGEYRSAREHRWEEVRTRLLERWDRACAERPEATAMRQPLYVVVEKILGRGERVPDDWPVQGTVGYEYLNLLNGIFVDRTSAKAFDAIYAKFIEEKVDFKELVYRCKMQVMLASMSSEVSVLGYRLDELSNKNRLTRDFTLNSLITVIREVIACFPVYRTYVGEGEVGERDRQYVEIAVARARRKNPATSAALFDFMRDTLLLVFPDNADDALREEQRTFVRKFQQVTGPVMAKGVEDTAFYSFNRLISLNEVGGDPDKFGTAVAALHQHNLERQSRAPHGMLASSTHDTKRSEDVRARINVLSEIPQEWKSRIFNWTRWNKSKKTDIDGVLVPRRNDEYLLYQTLVGTWPAGPLDQSSREEYVGRIQAYMLKAVREAKVETSWIRPNEAYEAGLKSFIDRLLAPQAKNAFLADFAPFAERVGEYGMWNSLAQTIIKLTSPGVPDIYQGTELWDLSLVDPDNRRPVDYAARQKILHELRQQSDTQGADRLGFVRELIERRSTGAIKLFTIAEVLKMRRKNPGLCTTGAYIPLDAAGLHLENVCAFARSAGDKVIVVAVPRLTAQITVFSGAIPCGVATWGETALSVPEGLAGKRYRNILTGEELEPRLDDKPGRFLLRDLFATLPCAILEQLP